MRSSDLKRQRAVVALLTYPTVAAAAEAAGVSEATLYRWLNDPDFAADLQAAADATYDQALRFLQGRATRAADTLSECLEKDFPPAIRLRAATTILTLIERSPLNEEIDALLQRLRAPERDCSRCSTCSAVAV